MHILIIPSERYLPKESPLSGIFQKDQAQALKSCGFKVGIISAPELHPIRLLMKGLSKWPKGIHVEEDEGIPIFKYSRLSWIPERFKDQLRWLRLRAGEALFRRYISQYGIPEIIHAHNAIFAGVLASKIKKKWQVPYVLTEHSSAYYRGLINDIEIKIIKDAFRNADRRIVVSPKLGYLLKRVVGDLVHPWEWVPNVLSSKFEKNTIVEKTERCNKDTFCFLNVGSIIEIKGQANLLYAFASKFKNKSDVQLRIIGDGHLKEELELLSYKLKIDKQVVFLGELNREQVFIEMQACDVYVHSSHYETFGVSLIEALSCGKPLVATTCGGPECIVCEGNGILVPPQDVLRLGEAMVTMRENIGFYNATWIRNDCIARFGTQTVVGQLSNVYKKITLSK